MQQAHFLHKKYKKNRDVRNDAGVLYHEFACKHERKCISAFKHVKILKSLEFNGLKGLN